MKRIAVAITCLAGLVLTACGGGASTPSGSPGTAAIKTTQASSIGPDWIQWDKAACKFKAAATHPATWTATLRKTSKPMRMGFGEQGEYTQLLVDMKKNMQDDATAAGIDLTVVNYNYPSTTDPVTQAQSLGVRKPDVVVSFNVITSIMDAVTTPFKTNCIPFAQVTSPVDGYPVFGASNEDAGKLAGDWLADYAGKQGWAASSVVALGAENPTIGVAIGTRVTKCQDEVLAKLPGSKKLSFNAGTGTATSQTGMTDWLTGHPTEKHILGCTIADIYAEGMANATKSSNRTPDLAVIGMGAAADGIAAIKSGGSMVATVDFHFDTYGDYLVPMAEDIFEGKPLPSESHQKLGIADKTTIK